MEREALKLALEALENMCDAQSNPDRRNFPTIHDYGKAQRACIAIKEALAQPEQEPVACVQDLDEVKRKHLVYEKGMDWKDPLYTAPPKREWVGLTIDEIDVLYGVNCGDGGPTAICEQFVQAVEAKLKEKNT